nr:hypothetical protein [Actinomycetota bacterium]
VLLSPVAIVNGFYVWPKLLPAAMLLAAAALVLTPLWEELRGKLWAGALVGGLLALAMMGHGSSVFGTIPLALLAAWRGLPSRRWVGVAALVGFAVMAPWSAYQKWDQPPGNRVVKWSLAGVTDVDPRGTREAIVDSYREAGVGGALENKALNFATMLGDTPNFDFEDWFAFSEDEGGATEVVKEVRKVLFFSFLPSLGLLAIAPLLMLWGRRRERPPSPEWDLAVACWIAVAIGCAAWGLLMFGNVPSRTMNHVGSYALPILALCGAVAGLRATFPRFASYWVAAAATLMLLIYVPAFDPLPETSYSLLAGMLAAASLAGFVATAFARDPR